MRDNILRWINLDTLGIGASLICAVHCALLPLLFAALPLLGVKVLQNEHLEYALLAGTFLIGCIALGRGYYRYHRRLQSLLLFTAGFILLLAGHFWPAAAAWAVFIIGLGAAAIVAAHLLNHRQGKACKLHKPH